MHFFLFVTYRKISPQVLALRKKQECNTKALRIVESLLESKVKTEYFLEAVEFKTQFTFK